MTKKLKLTKIELETKDGKKVELSIEEAKELHDQLHELFGSKFIPSVPIIIERDRYPWPYTPRWVESPNTGTPYPALPQIWCQTGHASGLNVTMKGDAV
jgi:hypothetical protein